MTLLACLDFLSALYTIVGGCYPNAISLIGTFTRSALLNVISFSWEVGDFSLATPIATT